MRQEKSFSLSIRLALMKRKQGLCLQTTLGRRCWLFVSANRYDTTMRSEARKKIEATRLEAISFQLDLSSLLRLHANTTAVLFSMSQAASLVYTCAEKLIFEQNSSNP